MKRQILFSLFGPTALSLLLVLSVANSRQQGTPVIDKAAETTKSALGRPQKSDPGMQADDRAATGQRPLGLTNMRFDATIKSEGNGITADFGMIDLIFEQVGPDLYDVTPVIKAAYSDSIEIPIQGNLYVNGELVANDLGHYLVAIEWCPLPACKGNCFLHIESMGMEQKVPGTCIKISDKICACVASFKMWPIKNISIPPNAEVVFQLDPHNIIPEYNEDNNVFSTVFGQDIRLSLKAILGGAYDAGTGMMDNALGVSGFLPATDPFPNDGEETHTDSVFLQGEAPNAIVDWVLVEIRDANDPFVILSTRPALLKQNGEIIGPNGSPYVVFNEFPDTLPPPEMHVSIRHRNHLGMITPAPVSFVATGTEIDFTTFPPIHGNPSAGLVKPGVYGLIPGDTNSDGVIDAADRSNTWNDRNGSGYLSSDISLDGVVDAGDRSIAWNNRNLGISLSGLFRDEWDESSQSCNFNYTHIVFKAIAVEGETVAVRVTNTGANKDCTFDVIFTQMINNQEVEIKVFEVKPGQRTAALKGKNIYSVKIVRCRNGGLPTPNNCKGIAEISA